MKDEGGRETSNVKCQTCRSVISSRPLNASGHGLREISSYAKRDFSFLSK